MAREIHDQLQVLPRKLVVLRNPIPLERLRESDSTTRSPWTGSGPNILAVGRLTPEKGFDLLLEAFAALAAPYFGAELVIAGAGHRESNLKRQATALGIATRVHFIGYQNPAVLFRHASLFVLSSRTEGLPNALLEAAGAGLPIVATPASRGLVDLLRHKEGVWLAAERSSSSLSSALEQSLSEIHPGQRYPHNWVEPFDLGCAISAYECAIDTALEE
jgi:glycosyltransferase involved in cell wall biosynthesis